MDDKFLIHVEVAGKRYGLWIDRCDEEQARKAVDQIRRLMMLYRKKYSEGERPEADEKDLLAMVAFHIAMENLTLKSKDDVTPFAEKIQVMNALLEDYLEKNVKP